jgi:hypothetical protein
MRSRAHPRVHLRSFPGARIDQGTG